MDNELEVIRHQMEETRSSLADKLETLEHQLSDTVEGATEAVANTVEAVKETVETVTETLDPRVQVERHPWLMMTGAVATGYIAGCLLNSSPERQPSPPLEQWAAPRPPAPAPAPAPVPAPAKEGPLASSLQTLKGLAIGSLMRVVRELVTGVAPSSMGSELAGVVDELTTRLGGKPLRSDPKPSTPERETEEVSCTEESSAAEATSSGPAVPVRPPKPNGPARKRRPARA